MGGSSTSGENWASRTVKAGWGPKVELNGGGTVVPADMAEELPMYCAAELYLNGEKVAELDLTLQKGDRE